MIPRIEFIKPLPGYLLSVRFDDGKAVIYDVKEDIRTIKCFGDLVSIQGLFNHFQLDQSRTCVSWTDTIDLPSDIIYEYGKPAKSPEN